MIDWEGSWPGDPQFDLVTFAFYAPGTRRLESARDALDPGLRSVYQAHLCIRQAE